MKEFFYLDPFVSSVNENEISVNSLYENEYHSISITDLLEIPDYLSMKNNNRKFQDMFEQKIDFLPTGNMLNMESLRKFSILIYQSNVLDLEMTLWNSYMKSGIGHLETNESNLKVWPSKIKSMIQFARCPTTISDREQIQVNENDYLIFVRDHLRKLGEKQQQIKEELLEKKTYWSTLTTSIENILETFIQENISILRLQYDEKIKLLHFDYREYILNHKFQEQHPTKQQIELSQSLFNHQHGYETTKQELNWIQCQIQRHKLLDVLSNIQLSLSTAIRSLNDMDLRHHLMNRHQHIIQQYRQEMIKIIVDTMQAKLNEFRKLFENQVALMRESLQSNQIMLDLIEKHLLLISKKIQSIYEYKDAIRAM
ncbi:hypothetical protein I4U23_010831 [Adineta vaga]|nr:hypothetical protein I4U23_010831 [Adineta vaga]